MSNEIQAKQLALAIKEFLYAQGRYHVAIDSGNYEILQEALKAYGAQ
jgi:hypothetical protein